MIFGLTACDIAVLGKWKIVEVAAGDVVMTQDDLADMEMDVGYIKLNKSGSCEINLLGDEFTGSWNASGKGAEPGNDIVIVYGDNLEGTAEFDESGQMKFKDSQGSLYTLIK